MRGYGNVLADLAAVVPDGMVCFFVSYDQMERLVATWVDQGVMARIRQNKLIFIETQNAAETSIALQDYMRVNEF